MHWQRVFLHCKRENANPSVSQVRCRREKWVEVKLSFHPGNGEIGVLNVPRLWPI